MPTGPAPDCTGRADMSARRRVRNSCLPKTAEQAGNAMKITPALAIGAGVGVAVGTATGNWGTGIAVGIGVAVAMAVAFRQRQ